MRSELELAGGCVVSGISRAMVVVGSGVNAWAMVVRKGAWAMVV